jgi:hypothetical protein
MTKDTKLIRVTSRGFVTTSRGRVISPIVSPYRESIHRIWSMLTVDRADIEEKLPDGSFIKLDIQNYDKDNTIKHDIATGTPHQVVKEIPKPIIKEEPKVEEIKEESTTVEEEPTNVDNTESAETKEESEANAPVYPRKNRRRNRNYQNNQSSEAVIPPVDSNTSDSDDNNNIEEKTNPEGTTQEHEQEEENTVKTDGESIAVEAEEIQ